MYGQRRPSRFSVDPRSGGRENYAAEAQRRQLFNPNFPCQNPNFYMERPAFHVANQSHTMPIQNANYSLYQQQQFVNTSERISHAVATARREIAAARESVSAWKVSEKALLALQVQSWSDLGLQMQEVPSLYSLMLLEGKVNAFIHCFVGTQRITTLYDLELAICKNEGVDCFERLDMGSLLRHPLVMHYFGVNGDATEVFKISTSEIITYLCQFKHSCKGDKIIVEEFLDFVAKKKSVVSWDKLGVRVQSVGMHVKYIEEAEKTEKTCLDSLKRKPHMKRKSRPPFSSEKKKLDERFAVISKYMKLFSTDSDVDGKDEFNLLQSSEGEDSDSSTDKDGTTDGFSNSYCKLSSKNVKDSDRVSSCPYPSATEEIQRLGLKCNNSPARVGKHIRFVSSSSDDEDSNSNTYGDKKNKDDSSYQDKFTSCSNKGSKQVSSCPYPSAYEEMTRIGSAIETSAPNKWLESNKNNKSSKRKRKSENHNSIDSAPSKLPKREKADPAVPVSDKYWRKNKRVRELNETNLSLSSESVRMFITTWKEICRECNTAEVLEKMLQSYGTSRRWMTNRKPIFLTYPIIGLLNVAVQSIKYGMWDSIYDTLQSISDCQTNGFPDKSPEDENLVVRANDKNKASVTVEDVIRKAATYFGVDHEVQNKSVTQKRLVFLKKLYSCEFWLAEQFGVKEFESLGYGKFLDFLEVHSSLLPEDLHEVLMGDFSGNSPVEVSIQQHQLVVILSQALNSLKENDNLTDQMISMLLSRQFPVLSLKVASCVNDVLDSVGKLQNHLTSKCLLYSVTLLRTSSARNAFADAENNLEATVVCNGIRDEARPVGCVTSKNALEVLLTAPMLSDLGSWSHWELNFAPSLGPLIEFLVNEVNSKELVCIVTREGKVIRIDHSATADSFLEAALEGSSFQTAVKLLSLFALVGGENHAPLSLLKCHACHAFEVFFKNSLEIRETSVDLNSDIRRNGLGKQRVPEPTVTDLKSGLFVNSAGTRRAVSVVSEFLLKCLAYLPSEFWCFCADVLVSGMQSVIKDAPSAILCECKKLEQRVMLHEIGLSLGIVEWIEDYHAFCSMATTDLCMSMEAPCIEAPKSASTVSTDQERGKLDRSSFREKEFLASVTLGNNCTEKCNTYGDESYRDMITETNGFVQQSLPCCETEDAGKVIESIRRDEFGLDANSSDAENNILRKQHARLGRALNCLSRELYSQDSHFLLELVQNADDNNYPENVEPTLTFILHESCIVVLNNEQGFTANNIRALCDVGNSTKQGSKTGYIGKKGIGFKSVFRVTDTPEIHSNGYHVKFDISEGQIGFVLPTVVPSCNIDFFSRLACSDHNNKDSNSWNTCIVLPLKSKLCEGSAMSSIMNMFSDLHPSLLLFLHRLKCIRFRNMLNDSLIVMKKEVVGDGIVKVSHGLEEMFWLVVSRKLNANSIRNDVQTTEISVAFTMDEAENGSYNPHLEQQPVFAFLPLRTYGLKFILQGDFVLPSSREEVDGDNPWNQWLLSEFPDLFVTAERYFCSLPSFRERPGKAVSVYMSFVPLIGEVHGFFSSLPRLILSKLRMSNCFLMEGKSDEWVPPCKVLRGWDQDCRSLLPDGLLWEHLGLGFLDEDIILSDPLAGALGIEEYGPKILIQIMSSLCHTEDQIKSMGLVWLSSWINSLYNMSFHSSGKSPLNSGVDKDCMKRLQKIPFIPLSNGGYSSVEKGPIWIQFDALSLRLDDEHGLEAFPSLNSRLRIVSPALLSASSVDVSDNVAKMLISIGVQRLSVHEILKTHVLPTISNEGIVSKDKDLMTEYLSFVMIHLQSGCPNCHVERQFLISEIRQKAFIMTNFGLKRPAEAHIHFSKGYGNPIDVSKLFCVEDIKWHELDTIYLNCPVSKSLSCRLPKWREFFLEIGITDFVQIVQVEKSVADMSDSAFESLVWDRNLISSQCIVKDWESLELDSLLSILMEMGKQENCIYLLEVLDRFWEEYFSDKTTGYCFSSSGDGKPIRSSFLRVISDSQWVASSMDDKLHCPKDLFYDCDAVHSVLGSCAPYAAPRIRSERLLSDIGFKTKVTLQDILDVLAIWRRAKAPFRASVAQMFTFYTFIWKEMTACKEKVAEELFSEPFIFMPYAFSTGNEDMVPGIFLSSQEVYWHDSTGTLDEIEKFKSDSGSISLSHPPNKKILCKTYPGLHEFFVNKCGVPESPPLRSYLDILLQLSTVSLPSQAANTVFQVFRKWAHGLNCGLLTSEDILYLKESLKKLEFAVLPTMQDKWVSLHPSYGLVCWCDDEKLKKEFKNLDNIDFLYFGKLSSNEDKMLQREVSVLMKTLEVPFLSEAVFREAVYYSPTDCTIKAFLVNWALPYAQRYLYKVHPDRYLHFKKSEFDTLSLLRVLVVDKLCYRNITQNGKCVSEKQHECSCLLQGNVLYSTPEADSHTLFMELSRLFFDGTPELHLANFLHIITTMVEAGSTEEQMEFFILNSQNVPKLPIEEHTWSLSNILSNEQNGSFLRSSMVSSDETRTSKPKIKAGINSNWPPVDWKNAPGFDYARENGLRTYPAIIHPNSSSEKYEDHSESIVRQIESATTKIEVDVTNNSVANFMTSYTEEYQSQQADHGHFLATAAVDVSSNLVGVSDGPETGMANFSKRHQLQFGTPNAAQAILTGRQGELIAFKYFTEKVGESVVRWINEDKETGLPYDIVIEKDDCKEYVEVKATKSPRKDWFIISAREWQFAVDTGDSYSIAHVALLGNDAARVSVFNNPLKLCQQGRLQLVVMMPRQQKDVAVVS